jgi:DNA-directed RNA polymerase subunit M/transcription elongation factor TFIIS
MDPLQATRTAIFLMCEHRLRPDCPRHANEEDDRLWPTTQRVLAGIHRRWRHDAELDSLRDRPPGDPLVHALAQFSALRGPDPDRICVFCVEEGLARSTETTPFLYTEQSNLEPLMGALDLWREGVCVKARDAEEGQAEANGPRCPHCHSGAIRVSLVQIRAGDEAMSEKYQCIKCDKVTYK